MPLFIPEDYTAKLAPETMEQAITYLKEIFPDMLARRLRLRRVTAPLFVLSGTGINDDLNGVERAVSFPIRDSHSFFVMRLRALSMSSRIEVYTSSTVLRDGISSRSRVSFNGMDFVFGAPSLV